MRRLGLLLAVMALLGLACGVPEDSSPQELSTDEIPESLQGAPTTTTSVPDDPGPGQEATLYFVDADNRVVPVVQAVPSPSVENILRALLATDPESLDPGVSSFIPPETTLLNVEFVEDDVLAVDLSEEFESVANVRFTLAVAQIVFTAAAFPGGTVGRVTFLVEGEPRDVNDDDGRVQTDPVSPNDFSELLAVS